MRRLFLLISLVVVALEAAARLFGRSPTLSRIAPGRSVLIYDDDCGLCSVVAMFVRFRADDLELIGFSALPREGVLEDLDFETVRASVHYVTAQGVEYHGGEAVTQVLRLVPGGALAAYLDWPVLRGLREIGYRLVTSQRSRISRLFELRR